VAATGRLLSASSCATSSRTCGHITTGSPRALRLLITDGSYGDRTQRLAQQVDALALAARSGAVVTAPLQTATAAIRGSSRPYRWCHLLSADETRSIPANARCAWQQLGECGVPPEARRILPLRGQCALGPLNLFTDSRLQSPI
jgi:hypothetical protein